MLQYDRRLCLGRGKVFVTPLCVDVLDSVALDLALGTMMTGKGVDIGLGKLPRADFVLEKHIRLGVSWQISRCPLPLALDNSLLPFISGSLKKAHVTHSKLSPPQYRPTLPPQSTVPSAPRVQKRKSKITHVRPHSKSRAF